MTTYQSSALLALGDPTRLAIVEHLTEGPLAVVDLAKQLPVTRPAVSQHLRVLKDAGLVIDQPAGNRRIYRVDPEAWPRCATSSTSSGRRPWPPTRRPPKKARRS